MKNIKNIILIVITFTFLFNCEENYVPEPLNYVTFSEASYSTSVDPGSSTDLDIIVFTGNITGSDRSFSVSVDGSNAPNGSYNVPSSFTVPGGTNEGILNVTLSDVNLGIGVSKINISIEQEPGLSVGDPLVISYFQKCNEVSGTLDFVFDGYASEVGWEILDELGGTVDSGDYGTWPDGTASASVPISLCQGRNYTLTIYDYYGDGLSYPNNGTYKLTIGGVVKASGGGDYGSSDTTEFDTN